MNFSETDDLANDIDSKIPEHVAIIMDGNGRWAERRMLKRLSGHEKGADAARKVVMCCCKLGIPSLTLYAFSTENWSRSTLEIAGLMKLLQRFLKTGRDFLSRNNIRLNAIGQLYRLPLSVRKTLFSVINGTSDNSRMQLNLALSYGGRAEITGVVGRIASEIKSGRLDPKMITSGLISQYLSNNGLSDPDVLIRTGGEMRISNFLLWQIAYTEIFFTKTLWPDFGTEEFIQIIRDFSKRDRRFGSVFS